MCGWVAVELGRGFAPYWVSLMTNPCASRRFAVQDVRVKVSPEHR